MPAEVPAEKWEAYFGAMRDGASRHAASKVAGIPYKTIQWLHKYPRRSSGWPYLKAYLADQVPDVIPHHKLSVQGKRALRDFEYFRRRYFGHISRPWHVEAAVKLIELLESGEKEYAVVNMPPGSGKSTLMTHDIAIWAAVRNRTNRCLIGTGAETTGTDYTRRIKISLERTLPAEADERDKAQGLALDASACLLHDFGRFKPESRDLWRAEKLVIAREGGMPAHNKEASFVAFGRKSNFLGGRYNLAIWDDLVTDQNSRSLDVQQETVRWYKNTAETRLEPGGLFVLQGQRIGATDLYRYALDLRDILDDELEDLESDKDIDLENAPRKYHHIVFKAHYEDRCQGKETHKHNAKPYPEGCLLDPQRLKWRDLRRLQINDPQNFATVYQQEDSDPESVLVNPLYIKGGVEPDTGIMLPGCWDTYRRAGQVPRENYAGDWYSVLSVDPSPTKYWAVGWWLYYPENEVQVLVDVVRQPMEAPDLLDWNHGEGKFTGLMEEWWLRSHDLDRPISHVIFEANAAQRFVLQYEHAKRWQALRSVDIVAHQTARNKSDPDLGVWALQPHYRFGRVRLPGHPETRIPHVQSMYHELTRYPNSGTDDLVMQHWFVIWTAANLFVRKRNGSYQFQRPSWVRNRRRGVA